MIISTSDNRLFRVADHPHPEMAHVWEGIEVKCVRGQFVPKSKARPMLVRKAASRIIEIEQGDGP